MIVRCARSARLLFAVTLLLFWPLPGATQVATQPTDERAWRGFLWEAVRDKERVLLLGSIHVGRPRFAALHADQMLRLLGAEVFVFEANVFDAKAAAEATQRRATYPEGAPGLDTRLDAALLARIEEILTRLGANIPACCRMKPWMLANTMVVLESIGDGFHPAYGSEARLFELAQASGKRIAEIESVDAQLRLFDEAEQAVQFDYLLHTVEAIESGASRTEVERLVSAWERGDGAEMDRLANTLARAARPAERFVYERIIKGRHPQMLAAVERAAASGQLHLMVIGALHFFGPDGLLTELRSRGFVLRRLP